MGSTSATFMTRKPGAAGWGTRQVALAARATWPSGVVPCSRGHRRPTSRPARAGAVAARRPGRVRLAHGRRHRALRRQGALAAQARASYFASDSRDRKTSELVAARGVDRADRRRQRERGAAARAAADQAPPAAVQRAAARRQEVPVHRGHGRRRVPARAVHARAAPRAACATSGRTRRRRRCATTLETLNKIFPYRPCEGPTPGRRSGVPCLDYHIGRCASARASG